MARVLKTTGVAAKLVAALGVDDDNTTLKDFKGNAVTVDGDVTVGMSEWNGVTFPYYRITPDGLNFNGVTWNDPEPVIPIGGTGNKKFTWLGVCASYVSGSYIWRLTVNEYLRLNSGIPRFIFNTLNQISGTTAWPTSGRFASCLVWRHGSVGTHDLYHAAEGASEFGTADGTGSDGLMSGANRDLGAFGGLESNGAHTANWLLNLWFGDELSQVERDALLVNPFSIFEASAGASVPVFMNSYRQRRR